MIIEYPSNIEKYFESFEIINSVCWLPNAYIFSDLKTIACAATGSKFQTVNSQAKNFLPIMSKSSAYWHMTFHKYTIRLSSIMTIRCLKIFTMCLPIWNGHIVEREHSRQTDIEFRKCSAFVDETAPCFLADYTKKARYKPDFKNIKEIGHTGFEPVNYGFRVHCLTNLANAQ